MLQPKDIDWLNSYKNKTRIYAVYERPTSDLGTYRLKVRGWREIINKTKRQPSECGKIFANKATDKGLISKREKDIPCKWKSKES